jgi:hypothetical protein
MNNATTAQATEKKTIHTLIAALNAKAAAAGCEVRVEWLNIDSAYGSSCGIALVGGTDEQQARAVQFAEKYFRAHIYPQHCVQAQYAWQDRGVMTLERFSAYVEGRGWVEGAGKLAYRVQQEGCPLVQARVIGMVYYPA